MNDKEIGEFSIEAIKELRNDFTFFVATSLLKMMATTSTEPKKFLKDVVLKWREKQVQALHLVATEMDKRMFEDEEFEDLFGSVMRKASLVQRETMIECIRKFCDTIEKALTDSMDEMKNGQEEDGLNI